MKETMYSIQRTSPDKVVSYLSPGFVNWVTEEVHKKYNTRYGKWVWGEAETIIGKIRRNPGFEYCIVSYEKHK